MGLIDVSNIYPTITGGRDLIELPIERTTAEVVGASIGRFRNFMPMNPFDPLLEADPDFDVAQAIFDLDPSYHRYSSNLVLAQNKDHLDFLIGKIDQTKKALGLPPEPFYLPKEVINFFQNQFSELDEMVNSNSSLLAMALKDDNFKKIWNSTFNADLDNIALPNFESGEILATRKAFGATLDKFAEQTPLLVGGSADLEPSNYTTNFANNYGDFTKDRREGRNLAFGVREFPMAAAMNGMSLHGGVIPFGGTFLVFADYERPALRLGSIQQCGVIHEFTHDSFWVGEDGPTHQPVEHAMALRSIPNFNVFRPADAKETAASFKIALQQTNTPCALLLTRQGIPILSLEEKTVYNGVSKGAYIIKDDDSPELIFLATGSEVNLALEVSKLMNDKRVRVVSMPCWELFDAQPKEYRDSIIPSRGAMKISFEAGITLGWESYIGPNGLSIGLDRFGASAPGKDLAEEFGFTPQKVSEKIINHLKKLL